METRREEEIKTFKQNLIENEIALKQNIEKEFKVLGENFHHEKATLELEKRALIEELQAW